MSEQSDQLNAKLSQLGVISPLPQEPPADATAPVKPPDLPGIELPRDGWGLDDFAREAGKVAKLNGVFRREIVPVTINKESGSIEAMDADRFRTYMPNLALLFKWKSTGRDNPPERVKQTMSADTARGTLKSDQFVFQQRKLTRVNAIRMPILRASGAIELLPEGYDEESGVFTMRSEVVVSDTMTLDAARELLIDLHREFPFKDWSAQPISERRESRELAKQVAGMLGFYGTLLTPQKEGRQGMLYNANTHRSGKTLLAKIAIVPVTGRCKIRAKPDSPEEFRKVLDSAAMSGSTYLMIDDISGTLRNQDLNAFMSASVWSTRMMNTQREIEVPVQTNIFLTGHNLDVTGDIEGRVLEVYLKMEEADVQEHKVSRVISEAWLSKDEVRSDICSALWTLVRHWVSKGRPDGKSLKPGYEEWCKVFGGIVCEAGFGDPCEHLATDKSSDPEFEDMRALVAHFAKEMEGAMLEITYDELISAAQELGCFNAQIEGKWVKEDDAMRFQPSARCNSRMGKLWSAKYSGRRFRIDEKRFVRFGDNGQRGRAKRYVFAMEKPKEQ